MQGEKSLYDRVYIAGIKAKIHAAINGERDKPVSQNTVFLALKDESTDTTPLRRRIREIAEWYLDEMEQPEEELATEAAA
jgi:hypothetical protein